MRRARRTILAVLLAQLCGVIVATPEARAASTDQLVSDSNRALQGLYAAQPQAAGLATRAKAILVFPKITKGAFIFGGQTGNGVLLVNGKPAGYYTIAADWIGLHFGGRPFSYALFILTDSALKYLSRNGRWTVGAGPSVVVVSKELAGGITSAVLRQDVYAFPFGPRGLMSGPGLKGSHIARTTPSL
jgi:lipid-binding SYLF domain-containing protein